MSCRRLVGAVALAVAMCLVVAACVEEADVPSGNAGSGEQTGASDSTGSDSAASDSTASDSAASDSTASDSTGSDSAGSDSTGASEESAATTAPSSDSAAAAGPLTASDRGVTETTILLGVPAIDVATLIDLGILGESGLDERAAWESAAANVNERGGVHGRMLELVFVNYLPLGQAQADAACVELVEDNEVFAALGTLLVPEGVLCYTELNGTPFVGISGSLTDETLERSVEVALSTDPSVSDLHRAMFDYAESEGVLERPVAVHGQDQRTVERAVRELGARGADVVSITTVSAPATDVQARVAEFEVIFARWRSDGAEAVINVGTSLDLVAAMGRQEFYIDVFGSEGGAQSYQADEEREFEAMRHLTMVAGAAPVGDGHEPTRRCEQAWDRRHPDLLLTDTPEQQFPVTATCAAIEMFAAVAEAAGPELTHESFKAAVGAADGVDLPLIGPARLGGERRSAPTHTNIVQFDEQQRLFVPVGRWPVG